MHARSRHLAGALAVAALVLGCADKGTQAEEEPDEEVDQGSGQEVDEAFLNEVALTVEDLPDGFDAFSEAPDPAASLDQCADLVDIDPAALQDNEVAEVGSDVRFERQDETAFVHVSATVTAFGDVDLARRRLDAYDDQAYFDCKAEDLEVQVAYDPSIEVLSVEAIPPAADGDAAAATAIVLGSGDGTAQIQLHEVLVGEVGLSVMVLASGGLEEEAVRALAADALDAMLGRLDDTQG